MCCPSRPPLTLPYPEGVLPASVGAMEIVFDGHNDVLLQVRRRRSAGAWFLRRGRKGHVDLARARAGGLRGGLFAGFVPRPPRALQELGVPTGAGYEIPPLAPGDPDHAWAEAGAMLAPPPPPSPAPRRRLP